MDEYQHHLFAKCDGEAEGENLAEILQRHFSVNRKSGGGDCRVFQVSSDSFRVSFRSEQVRDRVLQHDRKGLAASTGLAGKLHLSQEMQEQTAPDTQDESLQPTENPDQTITTSCENCTAEIAIPSLSVYTELLQPHFIQQIQEEWRDVEFHFDMGTLMLQLKGSPESVSFVQTEVHAAIRRVRSKEINLDPAMVAYLRSRGSEDVSRTYFCPAEVHAIIDLPLNSCAVLYGLSQYDIKKAEQILRDKITSKEVQIHDEGILVVHTESFNEFVEELNLYCPGVQVSVLKYTENGDSKAMCKLVGQETDLQSMEKKIHEFIQEHTKVTEYMILNEGMEITESLPLLLNQLGLLHLSESVTWNPNTETLELTGTQKAVDDAKAAIRKKTKGLSCKTVTVCQPGALSYFKADGQKFLDTLSPMLSCMAVLKREQATADAPERSSTCSPRDAFTNLYFEKDDKKMLLYWNNVVIQATISDKLPPVSDVIISPLCRSTSDSKILNAAGANVKTELRRIARSGAITVTGPGCLPCCLLVHVPCLCGNTAQQYLLDAIREGQKRKSDLITVVLDENELHLSFDEKMFTRNSIETALRSMNAPEIIRFEFAQETFYQSFINAADSFYKDARKRERELRFDSYESLHRHSVLCEPASIHLFSKQPQLLSKATEAVTKHYACFLSRSMLVEPYLHLCGEQTLSKILGLQQKHGVNILVRGRAVHFSGLAVKLIIAQKKAMAIIDEALAIWQLEHKSKLFPSIQWMINREADDPVQLNCEDNFNLELQYMCLQEVVNVKHENKTFTVNVADMTATDTDTSQVYSVLRKELTEPFPRKWSLSEAESFKKVAVDIYSLEYFAVERRFNGSLSSKVINKIERIENKNLWTRFSLEPSADVKLLFYGLRHADVEQVEKSGFFRPPETLFSSENAYGRGIYFYVDASSAQRCDLNTERQKVIFLARVQTGKYTVGKKWINVPPPVDPSNPGILYHSVVDNMDNPSVFVVFSPERAYPEYCITFKDEC